MSRIQGDLLKRTFDFSLLILNLTDDLPTVPKGWEIGRQLIRSGTGIGANVREADNAQSDAEFAHKGSIARKEAAETEYWLELCRASKILTGTTLEKAVREANELARILSTIVRTTENYINNKRNA